MTDPNRALLRTFARESAQRPPVVRLSRQRPWASATFTGARHRIVLGFDGDGGCDEARAFAAWAESFEFALPGHLVADIHAEPPRIEADGTVLQLEILTIETR